MSAEQYEFGMIGLGTMGQNLVLNMSDHGFSVAGYDKDPAKVTALNEMATGKKLEAFNQLESFIAAIKPPRVIMLLVPAGPIVDAVVSEISSI